MKKYHGHVLIWIDHKAAHIIGFGRDELDSELVRNPDGGLTIHHHAGSVGSGHPSENPHYFEDVAKALTGMGELLILGPGMEKTSFHTFLKQRHLEIAKRCVAVETAERMTDGELLSVARRIFLRTDKMIPQRIQS